MRTEENKRQAPASLLGRVRRAGRSQAGQSLVEFGLTAPLILLLLFGIVDFGRALFIANEMTNAAREGARVAILSSNPCNTVVSSVNAPNCSPGFGLTGESVCQAIENEGQLIATWANWGANCASGSDATPTLPNPSTSGSVGTAYVQITQSGNSTCPSTGSGGTTTTPRSVGNKAILVQIWYYYQPLTPLVGKFFPSGYHLASSVCARPEY